MVKVLKMSPTVQAVNTATAAPKLSNLVRARGFTRTQVTKLCNLIITDSEGIISEQKRAEHRHRLEALQNKLATADNAIFELQIEANLEEETLQEASDEIEAYNVKISNSISLLNNVNVRVSESSNHENIPNLGDRNHLKLPQVPLPEFSNGKGENFQKFIRGFEAIINKHKITDYEKFVYLSKQLSGSPKILVNSLDVDQQRYDCAKELLIKAFDSALTSKHDLINRLARIKLQENADPYHRTVRIYWRNAHSSFWNAFAEYYR